MKLAFKPKIDFSDAEYCFDRMEEKIIEDTHVYELVRKLVNQAFPTHEDKYDKGWEYFYLPVRRRGRVIALPFGVMEYKKEFFVFLHLLGNIHVKKGNKETEAICKNVFSEAARLIPLIKRSEKTLEKIVPYDFRTGKVKGKYVLEKLLPKKAKEKILKEYEKHLNSGLTVSEISLNDYLATAGICYKAAFSAKAKSLSPLDMYKKWADGRDNEMLSIKNGDSRKEFAEWFGAKARAGGHPFEIVFSWRGHGIHLYPPCSSSPLYRLSVTNYAYAPEFVKMAVALIKNKIPSEANELKKVLEYLAGETYFTVNDYSEHNFSYYPSAEYKKKYFPHIVWDPIKTVKWKKP